MSSNIVANELVEKFKICASLDAKNKLLEMYYEDGCRWANKTVRNVVYSDLIDPSNAEVASLVYQAFEKAVKNIRTDGLRKMSFKNFFFLMIKYQIYHDLKNVLNYRVIDNYDQELYKITRELGDSTEGERKILRKLFMNEQMDNILEYLSNKNVQYEVILILRGQGYTNREICKRLGLNEASLKSRFQYIKKLVRKEFGISLDF